MLPSHNVSVLIVDDNLVRANQVAQLIRVLGSSPVIAARLDVAASLVSCVDLLLVDDDAFAGHATAFAVAAAQVTPSTYRCVIASGSRFEQARSAGDYVITRPCTAIALGDVLAAASERRGRRGAARAPAYVSQAAAH